MHTINTISQLTLPSDRDNITLLQQKWNAGLAMIGKKIYNASEARTGKIKKVFLADGCVCIASEYLPESTR